jgi:hypothetical protein
MKNWKAIATALLIVVGITGAASAEDWSQRNGATYQQVNDRDHDRDRDRDRDRARNNVYNRGAYGWYGNRAPVYRRGDGDHDRDDGYYNRGYYPNSGYYGYYPNSGYYGYYPNGTYYPNGGYYPNRTYRQHRHRDWDHDGD